MRVRNYEIDFSNFQVNISINVKFQPGRRDESTAYKRKKLLVLATEPVRSPGIIRLYINRRQHVYNLFKVVFIQFSCIVLLFIKDEKS